MSDDSAAFAKHEKFLRDYDNYRKDGKDGKDRIDRIDRNDHIENGFKVKGHSREPLVVEAVKSEKQILREHHRFLRDDASSSQQAWEQRIAVKYYQRLFKEYALIDLSRVRDTGQVAMRWRTEREVRSGKGQFVCASLNPPCNYRNGRKRKGEYVDGDVDGDSLSSLELLFTYAEGGEKKQALVKVRLCPSCYKLLVKYHNGLDSASSSKEDPSKHVRRNEDDEEFQGLFN